MSTFALSLGKGDVYGIYIEMKKISTVMNCEYKLIQWPWKVIWKYLSKPKEAFYAYNSILVNLSGKNNWMNTQRLM
jgi:hypothetical protein